MGNENNSQNQNNNEANNEAPPQVNPSNNDNNNNINEDQNNNDNNKDRPLEESGFNLLSNSNNNNVINENNNNVINEDNNHENSAAPGLPNQDQPQPEPAPVGTETKKDDGDCPVPANLQEYEKHFSFDSLISKIKDTAKKAGLKAIYMALLLYYALESPTISFKDKAIIYGALGYFISPIDIVPDILPLIGLSDDIAVLAWAFSRVKSNITDMTREKAKTKLKIWFGNYDEKEIDDL